MDQVCVIIAVLNLDTAKEMVLFPFFLQFPSIYVYMLHTRYSKRRGTSLWKRTEVVTRFLKMNKKYHPHFATPLRKFQLLLLFIH